MKYKKQIILNSNKSELIKLAEQLENFAEQAGLTHKQLFNLNLCLDELITNTISYGYPDAKDGQIHIEITSEDDILSVVISDDAVEFDPLTKDAPDLYLPLDDRPIGGLGIHFVKQLTDHLSYRRENGKNVLSFTMKP
jgi:serine/threonine-protein kinase RsbW